MRRYLPLVIVLLAFAAHANAGLFGMFSRRNTMNVFNGGGGEVSCANGMCSVSGGGGMSSFSMPMSMSSGMFSSGYSSPMMSSYGGYGGGMPMMSSFGAGSGSCYSSSMMSAPQSYSMMMPQMAYSQPTYSYSMPAPSYYSAPAPSYQAVAPSPQTQAAPPLPSKSLPSSEYTPSKSIPGMKGLIEWPDALKNSTRQRRPLVQHAIQKRAPGVARPAQPPVERRPRAYVDCGCGGTGPCECGPGCQCDHVPPPLNQQRQKARTIFAQYDSMDSIRTVDYSGMDRRRNLPAMVDYSGVAGGRKVASVSH